MTKIEAGQTHHGIESQNDSTANRMAQLGDRARVRHKIIAGENTDHGIDIFAGIRVARSTKELLQKKFPDETIHSLLELVYEYLESPIVEDYFNDDEAGRLAWEKKVESTYGELGRQILERNKLRPNNFTYIVSTLPILIEMVSELAPKAKTELEKLSTFIDPRSTERVVQTYQLADGTTAEREVNLYKTLSRSEKQQIIEGITFVGQRLLQIMIEAELSSDQAVGAA